MCQSLPFIDWASRPCNTENGSLEQWNTEICIPSGRSMFFSAIKLHFPAFFSWLVVSTPLNNMKVSWGYYSQLNGQKKSCSKRPRQPRLMTPRERISQVLLLALLIALGQIHLPLGPVLRPAARFCLPRHEGSK